MASSKERDVQVSPATSTSSIKSQFFERSPSVTSAKDDKWPELLISRPENSYYYSSKSKFYYQLLVFIENSHAFNFNRTLKSFCCLLASLHHFHLNLITFHWAVLCKQHEWCTYCVYDMIIRNLATTRILCDFQFTFKLAFTSSQ